jgi:hypothetical protein
MAMTALMVAMANNMFPAINFNEMSVHRYSSTTIDYQLINLAIHTLFPHLSISDQR